MNVPISSGKSSADHKSDTPRIRGTLKLKLPAGANAPKPKMVEPKRVVMEPKVNHHEKAKVSEEARKRAEALSWLTETYPAVFDKPDKPLAIGIRQHIEAKYPEDHGLSHLRKAIKLWTNKKQYLTALAKKKGQRFNLDGSVAGAVSEKDRLGARERLNKAVK